MVRREEVSRRDALALLGAAGLAAVGGCPVESLDTASDNASTTNGSSNTNANGSTASCVLTPAQTEGPYFVDELLNRADIRSDPSSGTVQSGILLRLKLVISDVNNGVCSALAGATVDVWHCNAAGLYSDESANGTSGQKFLRGFQVTDTTGTAEFTTIYPGWYSGRTPHIHFKVRIGIVEFTSQLYFDESVTAAVYARSPYSARGTQDTSNIRDSIFDAATLLALTPDGDGYGATFYVGVAV